MYRMLEVASAIACLGQTISAVREENLNLSEAEKELLKWHYRLGHLSFRRIQSLLDLVCSHILKVLEFCIVQLVALDILPNVQLVCIASKVLDRYQISRVQ